MCQIVSHEVPLWISLGRGSAAQVFKFRYRVPSLKQHFLFLTEIQFIDFFPLL